MIPAYAWTDTHTLHIRHDDPDNLWMSWCVYSRKTGKPTGSGTSPGLECVFKDAAEFGFVVSFVSERPAKRQRCKPSSDKSWLTRIVESIFEILYWW